MGCNVGKAQVQTNEYNSPRDKQQKITKNRFSYQETIFATPKTSFYSPEFSSPPSQVKGYSQQKQSQYNCSSTSNCQEIIIPQSKYQNECDNQQKKTCYQLSQFKLDDEEYENQNECNSEKNENENIQNFNQEKINLNDKKFVSEDDKNQKNNKLKKYRKNTLNFKISESSINGIQIIDNNDKNQHQKENFSGMNINKNSDSNIQKYSKFRSQVDNQIEKVIDEMEDDKYSFQWEQQSHVQNQNKNQNIPQYSCQQINKIQNTNQLNESDNLIGQEINEFNDNNIQVVQSDNGINRVFSYIKEQNQMIQNDMDLLNCKKDNYQSESKENEGNDSDNQFQILNYKKVQIKKRKSVLDTPNFINQNPEKNFIEQKKKDSYNLQSQLDHYRARKQQIQEYNRQKADIEQEQELENLGKIMPKYIVSSEFIEKKKLMKKEMNDFAVPIIDEDTSGSYLMVKRNLHIKMLMLKFYKRQHELNGIQGVNLRKNVSEKLVNIYGI